MAKKLILDIDGKLWDEVLIYKIKSKFKNNNEAVVELVKKGLKK